MDKERMLEQMKDDLKALGEIGTKAMEDGKTPSASSMEKYLWMTRPITKQEFASTIKKYNMTADEFREYARFFRTFYVNH